MSHETQLESQWEFSKVDEEFQLHRKYWKNVLQSKDDQINRKDKTIAQLVYLVRAKNELIAQLKSTQNRR
jgi:hypothetical protein